jgi:Pectinacetylesterase
MRRLPTLSSRFVATVAAATTALATVAAACATETPTSESAASEPTSTATAAPSESTTTGAPPTNEPADSTAVDSATEGSQPAAGQPDLQAFSQCMRDNGITEFPDPSPDGISLNGTGIDPDSPQFKAAQEACNDLRPEPDASPSGSSPAGESDWEKVVPSGECMCAEGSEFAFWERRADPTKVVLYLDGGGSCFDATTCAFAGTGGENDYYDFNLSTESPGLGDGIWNFDRADNPFGDYSFIYVPLCTGDLYLGDVTREYSPKLTVEHNGFVNGTAALDYLSEHYPDAAQVVVLGKTAGSVAAPVYGGLVADLLPDAQVTVFGAQSGHAPDDPDFNAEIAELWGVYGTMPDWEVNDGLTARDWGPTQFWIQAGLHDPDIVMARFDYAYDPNAARSLESRGVDASTLEMIDANEAAIEAAGVVQHSYTAPGEEHGIFEFDTFYKVEVNGVRLVDWIEELLAGQPLDDVHCEQCETS